MNFLENFADTITSGINNCMLGKIESFNAETMKANVMPLVKNKNKDDTFEDISMLIEVPVSLIRAGPFVIRPPYKSGDTVLVVFADSDIENTLLSGDTSEPNSTRRHSLDDAIVVGGIMPFTIALPDEHSEDLVIAKDDFTSKIVLGDDGSIEIKSDKQISICGPTKDDFTSKLVLSEDGSMELSSSKQITISGPTETSTWN